MSRYEIYHKDKGLAFGEDEVFGEWVQIWERPIKKHQRDLQDSYGAKPEDMLVDEANIDGLTYSKLVKYATTYGFTARQIDAARFPPRPIAEINESTFDISNAPGLGPVMLRLPGDKVQMRSATVIGFAAIPSSSECHKSIVSLEETLITDGIKLNILVVDREHITYIF